MYINKKQIIAYLEEGYNFFEGFLEVVYYNNPDKEEEPEEKTESQERLLQLAKKDPELFHEALKELQLSKEERNRLEKILSNTEEKNSKTVTNGDPSLEFKDEHYLVLKTKDNKYYMGFFKIDDLKEKENPTEEHYYFNPKVQLYEAYKNGGIYYLQKYTFEDVEDWICDAFNIYKNRFYNNVRVKYGLKNEKEEHRSYNIYTKNHNYTISCTLNFKDFRKSYIGGYAGNLYQRPGEDWHRSNDFPDGRFYKGVVFANRDKMLTWEILPLSPTAVSNQHEERKNYKEKDINVLSYNQLKGDIKTNDKLRNFILKDLDHPVYKNTINTKKEYVKDLSKYFKIRYSEALSRQQARPVIIFRCRTETYQYTYTIVYSYDDNSLEEKEPKSVFLNLRTDWYDGEISDEQHNLDWLKSFDLNSEKENKYFPVNLSTRDPLVPVSAWKEKRPEPVNVEDSVEEKDPTINIVNQVMTSIKKRKVPINYPVGEDIPPDALVALNEKGQIVLAQPLENKCNYIGFNVGKRRSKGDHIPLTDIKKKTNGDLFVFRDDQEFEINKKCYVYPDGKLGQEALQESGKRVLTIGTAVSSHIVDINPFDYGIRP